MRFIFLVVLLFLGVTATAGAAWNKATSPNFIVYSESRQSDLKEFVEKLERFDAFLQRRAGIDLAADRMRLTVFMVDGGVGEITGDPGETSLRGYFTNGPNGPMAVVERADGRGRFAIDADTILFHEYVHHFMYQYFRAAYPPWFSEGFAEFYSTTDFDDEGRATYGNPAMHRVVDLYFGPSWPVERLLNSNTNGLDASTKSSFYGRAWLLTHYLSFAPDRAGQLNQYIKQINDGVDSMDAALRAFGDLGALELELNAYLKKRKIASRRELDPTPISGSIEIAALGRADSALVPDFARIMTRPEAKQLQSLIKNIESIRPSFPDSALPSALLSEAHFLAGDYHNAGVSADAALAIDAGNALALLYKGRAESKLLSLGPLQPQRNWASARSSIVKANRAEPENPFPLYAYYMSFLDEGVAPRQIARDGLFKAFALAPRDPEILTAMILLLIGENELDAALQLLKPIAYQPHGGLSAVWALALMARLELAIKNGTRYEDVPTVAPRDWNDGPVNPHVAPTSGSVDSPS